VTNHWQERTGCDVESETNSGVSRGERRVPRTGAASSNTGEEKGFSNTHTTGLSNLVFNTLSIDHHRTGGGGSFPEKKASSHRSSNRGESFLDGGGGGGSFVQRGRKLPRTGGRQPRRQEGRHLCRTKGMNAPSNSVVKGKRASSKGLRRTGEKKFRLRRAGVRISRLRGRKSEAWTMIQA
jgi:hypothetical protein